MGFQFSAQEIWARVFDATNDSLRADTLAANAPAVDVQWQEVLNRVFDEGNNILVTG